MGFEIGSDYVFFHVPKCGGTTIRKTFGKVGKNTKSEGPNWYNENGCVTRYVEDNGIERLKSKFTFSFCRNPYDRAVSAYKYLSKVHGINFDKYDFFTGDVELPARIYKNYDWHYLISQSAHLSYQGDLIELDFLGRVENFKEDFKTISDKINLIEDIPFRKKHNSTDDSKLDDEFKDIVYYKFKDDFINFGYER